MLVGVRRKGQLQLRYVCIRIVQIHVHLFVARVPFGSHDILNVVEERIESFVDDETCLLFRIFELFVFVLPRNPRSA